MPSNRHQKVSDALNNKSSRGRRGEELACTYLRRKRYQIVARNYRGIAGEIDIVAVSNDTVIAIEVKYRRDHRFGMPQEAVSKKKIRKIINTLNQFSLSHPHLPERLRIDVIAITETTSGTPQIEHIQNVTG